MKTYTTATQTVYTVHYWLLPYHAETLPSNALLTMNCAGAAAVVYTLRSGCRSGYERLVSADFLLKYDSSRPRLLVIVTLAILQRSDSTESLKDKHNRGVMDEEIIRLARDRKMVVMEVVISESESEGAVLDEIFSNVVEILDLGDHGLFKDPAFLLGKNVGIGGKVIESEEYLMGLFQTPG